MEAGGKERLIRSYAGPSRGFQSNVQMTIDPRDPNQSSLNGPDPGSGPRPGPGSGPEGKGDGDLTREESIKEEIDAQPLHLGASTTEPREAVNTNRSSSAPVVATPSVLGNLCRCLCGSFEDLSVFLPSGKPCSLCQEDLCKVVFRHECTDDTDIISLCIGTKAVPDYPTHKHSHTDTQSHTHKHTYVLLTINCRSHEPEIPDTG